MAMQAQKPDGTLHTIPSSDVPGTLDEISDKFTIHRPARVHLSPEETRARMEAFVREREEAFIAAIREDQS